ncbi:MAG TPA: RNA polymerase subunit sigma-24 [Verrucomicrobiales bacterium]|jgi:RNA polymerase sigma-70 factor (ECF subfamily)|nr:RNA polymerase subunit sigma-24 [Verrucomicrobiales bacterium]
MTAAEFPQDFHTTHWSIVTQAADTASPGSLAALEKLCRAYWFPLYAYVRRRGHEVEEARDLTQGFFAVLLEKNYVADADTNRGRFRTFLLSALGHYLANEWNRAHAKKRGGGTARFSMDALNAEERYRLEPADAASPERFYDRRWAEAVLATVLAQLRREFEDTGRGQRFDDLKAHLLGDAGALPYEELAARMGIGLNGVRSVVHRLRKRFATLTRNEIAQTVTSPEEVEDEIRHLFQSLAE